MNDTELLLAIAITTIVTTLIQTIEMWLLVRSSKQTNHILSHPGELLLTGITEWIKGIWDDEKAQKTFFTFAQILAQNMIMGAREAAQNAGLKPPKIRNVQDAVGYILSLPGAQARIDKAISGAMDEAVTETAVEAGKDYLKAWGLGQ